MPANYVVMPACGAEIADEWVRLGVESHMAGNLPLALARYGQALRVDPRHVIATQNTAIVYAQSPGFMNEGLLAIERAEMLDGKFPIIKLNKAQMFLECERIDDALNAAASAADMTPPDDQSRSAVLMTLASALTTAGHAEKAGPLYEEILAKEPKHPNAGPNSCFYQTLTDASPGELLRSRQRWWRDNKWVGTPASHANDRDPDRVLRIGYVGGDFKSHSAAFIFRRVVEHHTGAVVPYLYSTLPTEPDKDMVTRRMMVSAGCELDPVTFKMTTNPPESRWRDISTVQDDEAAAMIRRDKIDILVDLAAHTNGGRLKLFTHKPAPVQVTAWGFAHGTGLPEIDYFFADPVAVPESERQHYSEGIVDIPCIVTMEEPAEYKLTTTSAAPFKRNGYVTFGTFGRYEKMSEQCVRTFAEILRRVPDSRIIFKDAAFKRPFSIRRVQVLMEGIAPERLMFSIATTHPDHLLSYQMCDVALDPWPHGGGVVSLEQLYMGVPLLTMYGTQPAGRTGSSVLTALGRTDWIARTPAEYVETAVRMASDPSVAAARKTLSRELLDSPVVRGYVESVEAKYKEVWRTWCLKQKS